MNPIRRRPGLIAAVAAVGLLAAACGGGGNFSGGGSGQPKQQSGKASLTMLIGSSGAAETAAVQAATKAWAAKTGNTVTVTPAQNMDQQLGQAFAANKPPDVFYLDAAKFADYASQNALYAYGDKVSGASDFYPALKSAFTWNNTFYCAPKDYSTLALEINTAMWAKAGLKSSDVPTTWAQLTSVATRLKSALPGVTPLVISSGHDRVDAFLVEAGGGLVDPSGKPAADTPANVAGLDYAKSLLQAGLMKYASQVGAGWGGEALGKGKAAMTIEGNWIAGAMKTDYPNLKYQVVAMPAGPKGKGTLLFTQCWGIPQATKYRDQALNLVEYLTSVQQQLSFAKAFGVMPSRASARAQYEQQFPADRVFMQGADYGVGPVKLPKISQVLADFDNSLNNLATTSPQSILSRLQKNLQAATGG